VIPWLVLALAVIAAGFALLDLALIYCLDIRVNELRWEFDKQRELVIPTAAMPPVLSPGQAAPLPDAPVEPNKRMRWRCLEEYGTRQCEDEAGHVGDHHNGSFKWSRFLTKGPRPLDPRPGPIVHGPSDFPPPPVVT